MVELARTLKRAGYELVSTGGTHKALAAANLSTTPIEDVTGVPEMLSGRVKTLHPNVHGGILADSDDDTHAQQLQHHGITPINVVVCNLYPFQKVAAKPDATRAEAIENIDIGGVTLIRAAAKNHASVLVITDPSSYTELGAAIAANAVSPEMRLECAIKAFEHTRNYETAIHEYLLKQAAGAKPEHGLPLNLKPAPAKATAHR